MDRIVEGLLKIIFFVAYLATFIFVGNRILSLNGGLQILGASLLVLLASVLLAQVSVERIVAIIRTEKG